MNLTNHRNQLRRGNALILVVGILVLLVLVATAFITKTQSGRATAVAQRDASLINDRSATIHNELADEIAQALFAKDIAATFEAPPDSANTRRVAPSMHAPRYGHDANFPYNYAPYEVVPWTNPPDDDDGAGGIPPIGPDNPFGGPSFGDARWLRDTEPQRADIIDYINQGVAGWTWVDGSPETYSHWQHLTNLSRSGNAWRIVKDISNVTGEGLLNNTNPSPLIVDLDVPLEQWPTYRPTRGGALGVNTSTGFPAILNGGAYNYNLWRQWQTLPGWAAAQLNTDLIPHNFLNLSDLNGDGIQNDPSYGERPLDAYIAGTNRWHTEKWITDADGDGMTDAFWHLYPQSLGSDMKQVIAISVTDNSARGNINVATSFQRKDYYGADSARDRHGEGTKGHTPADLAIIGQNNFTFGNVYPWRVGFMDNLANLPGNGIFPNGSLYDWVSYNQIGPNGYQVNVDWNTDQWDNRDNASLLDELGIEVNQTFVNPVFNDTTNMLNLTDDIYSRYGRLWYWQLAGRDPFSATNGLRPFTLSDELELRVAEGNNYQFVGSRFERSLNDIIGQVANGEVQNQFLRSGYHHSHEASEYRDQLDNRQLLYDNRHKLTMFSGVRNDLLPPWLRWEDRFWNRHDPESLNVPSGYDAFDIGMYEDAGIPAALRPGVFGSTFPLRVAIEGVNAAIANGQEGLEDAVLNWREQSRTKLDLREYYADSYFGTRWWESNSDGKLTFAERLPLQLLLAMTDAQEHGGNNVNNVFHDANAPLGTYSAPDPDGSWDSIDTNYYQQARLVAAGLASNMLAYRDEDDGWRQHSTLPFTYNSTEQMSNLPLSQAVTPPIIGRQSNDGADPFWGTYVPFADANVAGPNESAVEMLGLEAQPFISEVFLAHAHQAKAGGVPGACCLDSEVCVEVSEDTCLALLNGTWDPSDCDTFTCPGGACCLELGGCVFVEQDECDSRGGQFQGEGASCLNAPCIGACCVDGIDGSGNGECIDVSSQTCSELGAAFAGFDTACASTACTPLGSCCFESSTCMDVLNTSACLSLGGTYNPGEFCVSDPCEAGACCLPEQYGACVEVSADTCSDLFGNYLGIGNTCDVNPCNSIGACCFGSGSCVDAMNAGTCAADGGTFIGGASCADGALLTSVFSPTADASILQTLPTFPLGTSVNVLIGEEAGGGRDHFLVDYQISDAIEAADVTDAVIVLDYQQFSGVQSTVTVARLAQDWGHETATWNTFDGVNIWPNGEGAVGEADESLGVKTITVGTSGDVKIHVEEFVQDAIVNRDRKLSLIFYKTASDGAESKTEFASSETTTGTAPLLTVQYIIGSNPCAAACCFNTSACEELSLDTCTDLGGTYVTGVTCEEGACTGACCFSTGGCENMSQESCESSFDATFLGSGTSCDIASCGIEGACCLTYTPDEIWLNEILYDNSPVWINEFQYDNVDTAWVNEIHYDTLVTPWVNEFQYDTDDTAWLNEIHYDNTGADVDEFIEIALDSYIDPATVSVLLYDGATGLLYDTLAVNTFAVGEVEGGKTIYSLVLPLDGLQNDVEGVAIVIDGNVEQFVSYEGIFVAVDGAASGLTSVDYGISEAVTVAAGASIGLTGIGSHYADFLPIAMSPDTVGLVNTLQVINEGELLEIALDTEIDPSTTTVEVLLYNGTDGTIYDTLNLTSFAVGTTYAGNTLYSITTSLQEDTDGIAITVGGVLQQFISYEGVFAGTAGPALGIPSQDVTLTQSNDGATETLGLIGTGSQFADFTWRALPVTSPGDENAGQTIENLGDFVEIALDQFVDPSTVQVLLYDGADGTVYDTITVDTFATSGVAQGGKLFYSSPAFSGEGMQDGIDGIAIVIDGVLEQFVSYEGTFLATDGAASGETSEDFDISESGVAIGTSIGLDGIGSDYSDFSPVAFGASTPSAVNEAQQVDHNELIEIALDAEIDTNVIDVEILLYNGSDGTLYETISGSDLDIGDTSEGMTLYFTFTSLRNGNDGIAVTVDGAVKQFISYEGQFTATDGAAATLVSDDIPVTQTDASPLASIGLTGAASEYSGFTWASFNPRTPGAMNLNQTVIAYTEFIEIAIASSVSILDVSLELYGSDGLVYEQVPGSDFTVGESQSGMTLYSVSWNEDFLANGPAGVAIVYEAEVTGSGLDRQFLSYEGIISGADGVALGMTSNLIPIPLNNSIVGASIGLTGTGSYYSDFVWVEFETNSMGDINAGQTIVLLEEAEVCVELSEAACLLLSGTFEGKATDCATASCGGTPIRGACCFETGNCQDIDSATCHELEGVYQGDGISCLDAPCVTEGACCLESTSCLDLSQSSCEDIGGSFEVGEICADLPCIGACCLPNGSCSDSMTLTECVGKAGTYREGFICADIPCIGACCVAPLTCDLVSDISCVTVLGGVFQGFGTVCTSDPCAIGLPGACCILGGDGCAEVFSAECVTLGGVFSGDGTTCQIVVCLNDAVLGACCLPTGFCTDVVSQVACDSLSGTYQGDNTSCASAPCTGACCLPSGSCVDVLERDCDSLAGEFLGDGTSCSTTPCRGSCCLGSGSCADIIMQPTCDLLGGVFMGFGTTCRSEPCYGRCCLAPAGCEVVSESTCIGMGGAFHGEGTTCIGDPCIAGACCLDSGSCLETTQSGCDNLGAGTHFIDGASCDTDPCLGACCLWAGGCELLSIDTCDSLWDPDESGTWEPIDQPGFWNGFGTLCGPIACQPTGSCCLPSGSCVDIMDVPSSGSAPDGFVFYCEEVLGGKYNGGASCSENDCASACCYQDGTCEMSVLIDCDNAGGVYYGGFDCDDNVCDTVGQCCLDDGSCLDIVEVLCDEYGGDWDASANCTDDQCVSYFIVTDDTDECPQETVAFVQLANPFDREIDLNNYAVELFGQDVKLAGLDLVLPPATETNPATLILYTMPSASTIIDPLGVHDFNDDWLDFLDIEFEDLPDNSILVAVPNANWVNDRTYYDGLIEDEQNSVALYKFDGVEGVNQQRVLIDRLDPPNSVDPFDARIVEDLEKEWLRVGSDGYVTITDNAGQRIEAVPNTSALLLQWDRATRAWATDIPDSKRFGETGWHNDQIDPWEKSPRYVFAAHDAIRSEESRNVTSPNTSPPVSNIKYTSAFLWADTVNPQDPDDLDGDSNPDSNDEDLLPDDPDAWIVVEVWSPRAGTFRPGTTTEGEVIGGMRFRKPTYFDMNHAEERGFQDVGMPKDQPWSYPDKGWYGQRDDADGDLTTSDSPAWEDVDADDLIQITDIEFDMSMAFPLQMLQKDDDFEQVGEVLNCWLFGHMLEGTHDQATEDDSYLELPLSPLDDSGGGATAPSVDAGTITTFSEFMYPRWDTEEDWFAPWVAKVVGDEVILSEGVNRLRFLPEGDVATPLMMGGRSELDPFLVATARNHPWPRLPIASRVMDSFVCDGPGRPDYTGDGLGDDLNPLGAGPALPSIHSFYNANGYSGKSTPGIININTAPVEVLRMLPHMFKLVHETSEFDSATLDQIDRNPRTLLPESIIQWREQAGYDFATGPSVLENTGFTGGPDYRDRSIALGITYGVGPKHTRGFSSPSEIGMLRSMGSVDDVMEPWHIATNHQSVRDATSWSIDFARWDPFGNHDSTSGTDYSIGGIVGSEVGAPISTEVNRNSYYTQDSIIGDGVSGDFEEMNMLQSGISNLIGTTSDMFTVHFRIRTFKRNSVTGVWDATDLDYIVDDSRYVMLVDRSNVESPSDKPRILYFEKLPN